MRKIIAIGVLYLLIAGCKESLSDHSEMINTDHLEHLYEPFEIDGKQIGSIWIYCEAPEYKHLTDEDEGYSCVDDVARALVFYCKEYQEKPSEAILIKIKSLSEFILYMQSESGYFYNFMFPDKSINTTHENSVAIANWWSWRAFWALSELCLVQEESLLEIQQRSKTSMDKVIPRMLDICVQPETILEVGGIEIPACLADIGTDQAAVIIIGLSNYFELYPSQEIKDYLVKLGSLLVQMQKGNEEDFPHYASLSWQNKWHAWGNSQAYALLKVGQQLNNRPFINAGKREVDNFFQYYIEKRPSSFSLEKNNDKFENKEMKFFSQIAYNLRPMIYASVAAFEESSEDKYAEKAANLASWFFGKNQSDSTMYDLGTGRTYDGIVSTSEVNKNSGAESTIEGLLSLQYISKHEEILKKVMDKKTFEKNNTK